MQVLHRSNKTEFDRWLCDLEYAYLYFYNIHQVNERWAKDMYDAGLSIQDLIYAKKKRN